MGLEDATEQLDDIGLGLDSAITYKKLSKLDEEEYDIRKKKDYNLKKIRKNKLQFIKNPDRNQNALGKITRTWAPKKEREVGLICPESFEEYFEYVDCWGWSSVMAASLVAGQPLRWTMFGLWQKYSFFEQFQIERNIFFNFADRLEKAYSKHHNTYHNSTHATDVLQTVHVMINHCGLFHWMSDLELMAMLFAAAIHDAEHTGTTNAFHVSIQSKLALLYKDQSVLENHHLHIANSLLDNENCNILANLKSEEREYFRFLFTEMVLGTDMAVHFAQLNDIKNTINIITTVEWDQIAKGDKEYPEQLEKQKIMSLMVHAADISNALKPWHYSHYSTMQLLQEFFTQGDMCKMNRMPPSPLCDRKTTKIPTSQINFSKFLVLPTFELLTCTVRLLANIFLPVSQKEIKKYPNTSKEMTMDMKPSTDRGGGCSLLVPTVKLFRKESLRPEAENLSADEVVKECDAFEKIWREHMEVNGQRWTIRHEKESMLEERFQNERCRYSK